MTFVLQSLSALSNVSLVVFILKKLILKALPDYNYGASREVSMVKNILP